MRVSPQEAREALARIAEREGRARPQQPGNLALLQQAEVAVDQLTGDPVWDTFAQRIQVLIEQEKGRIEPIIKALMSSPTIASEGLHEMHKALLHAQGRIEAWESVLRLPIEIKKAAEQAKSQAAA